MHWRYSHEPVDFGRFKATSTGGGYCYELVKNKDEI